LFTTDFTFKELVKNYDALQAISIVLYFSMVIWMKLLATVNSIPKFIVIETTARIVRVMNYVLVYHHWMNETSLAYEHSLKT